MKKALRQAHQQLNDSQVLHVHTIKRLYQGRESEQGLPPALMHTQVHCGRLLQENA